MLCATIDDTLDEMKEEIKAKFESAKLEFSTRLFRHHAELWVYVTESGQKEAVRSACEILENRHENDPLPIWVFVSMKEPSNPDEKTEEWYKKRRQAFRDQLMQNKNVVTSNQ